jgi:hypothetical protein
MTPLSPTKLLSLSLYLILALFLLFGAKPLILNQIILPEAREDETGFNVEEFDTPLKGLAWRYNLPLRSFNHKSGKFVFNTNNASLAARALWEVKIGGEWQIVLVADDYAQAYLDGEPLIIQAVGPHPKHRTKRSLHIKPGRHLLEVCLTNYGGVGNLAIYVIEPGSGKKRLLNAKELTPSSLALGKLNTWLTIGLIGEWLGALLLFSLAALWLIALIKGIWRGPFTWLRRCLAGLGWQGMLLILLMAFFTAVNLAAFPIWLQAQIDDDPKGGPEGTCRVQPAENGAGGRGLWLWRPPVDGNYAFEFRAPYNPRAYLNTQPLRTWTAAPNDNDHAPNLVLSRKTYLISLELPGGKAGQAAKLQVKYPKTLNFVDIPPDELTRLEPEATAAEFELVRLIKRISLALAWLCGLILAWRLTRGAVRQTLLPGLRGFMAGLPIACNRLMVFVILASLAGYALIFSYGYMGYDGSIRGDGVGYYSYLPAIFLHGEVGNDSLAGPLVDYGYNHTSKETIHHITGMQRFAGTDGHLNKYGMGVALMASPAFGLSHLITVLADAPPDGYSMIYQHGYSLFGWLLGVAGLFILGHVLSRRFPPLVTVITLSLITFGTTLYHTLCFLHSFSHVYSFFLFALVLLLVPNWLNKPGRGKALGLGVVLGLIIMVRNYNILFFICYMWLFGVAGLGDLRRRAAFLWRRKIDLIIMGLCVFILFTPQMVVWKLVTDSWITYSYRGEGFPYVFEPKLLSVLFSVRKGLFFWHPVLLFACVGFFFMRKRMPGHLPAIAVFLLGVTYLISSWHSWMFGASFGHRGFTDSLPLFALGLACLVEWVILRKTAIKACVALLAVLLVSLNLFQTYQYWRSLIPIYSCSWEIYRQLFLSLEPI